MDPRRCDALVVVKTPLQVLNALEARRHFAWARPALAVLTSRKFPRDLLLPLVEPAEWCAVACFALDPQRRPLRVPLLAPARSERLAEARWVVQQWRLRRRYDAFFRRWRAVPDLVLGNYHQPHFRHLAHRFAASRCILLDDGTDTFRVAARRRELAAGVPAAASPDGARTRKQRWLAREVAWNETPRPALVFFSTYDLDLPAGDALVRNRYLRATERVRGGSTDDRVLFLGQPLCEDGYLTREDFAASLAAVRRAHHGERLAYVPHPREDRRALAGVLEACGIAVQEIAKPFEFHLLDTGELPGTVASFFSSALDNCRLIWGARLRIVAYRLAPERLRTGQAFVAEVYRYLGSRADRGIDVRDLAPR